MQGLNEFPGVGLTARLTAFSFGYRVASSPIVETDHQNAVSRPLRGTDTWGNELDYFTLGRTTFERPPPPPVPFAPATETGTAVPPHVQSVRPGLPLTIAVARPLLAQPAPRLIFVT
jgi:hypothetical protein